MSRYTSAYSEFIVRVEEVNILLSSARQLEKSPEAFSHGNQINALSRGEILLLSSHIEAYIKELGECALDAIFDKAVCRSSIHKRFFYYSSKEWLSKFRDIIDPDDVSAGLFDFLELESELWGRSGPLPRPVDSQIFSKGFSNPKFKKIKAYLARFGYDRLQHDINRILRADAILIVNQLDMIVDTRNAIAHGELSATKTPSEVAGLMQSARRFCRATDDSFSSWCRDKMCTIR